LLLSSRLTSLYLHSFALLLRFASIDGKRRIDVMSSARLCDGVEKRYGVTVGGWEEGSEVVWNNANDGGVGNMGILRMTRGNVCEVGVDFHVSGIVEDVVRGGDEVGKVKGWMWEFESGVNLKRVVDGEEEAEGDGREEYERVWKEKMVRWRKEYLERRLMLK